MASALLSVGEFTGLIWKMLSEKDNIDAYEVLNQVSDQVLRLCSKLSTAITM